MNTTIQAHHADYILACAFKPFDYPVYPEKLQVFTIHTPRIFPKPMVELSQALTSNLVEVKEVDAAGSVQELYVCNHSENYLLIYEGSLLRKAKQNRVVNATLLVLPLSKTVIPASCVERCRWKYSSPTFENPTFEKSPCDAPQFLRKSIRSEISSTRSLKGSQSRVWKEIDDYAISKMVHSASSDFDDLYHRSAKTEMLFPLGLNLPATEGILLQAMGEGSMDFVASESAFAGVLPRLIAGYELPAKERKSTFLDNPGKILAKRIANGSIMTQPSAGSGTDIRIETSDDHISALVAEGEVVAMSITTR